MMTVNDFFDNLSQQDAQYTGPFGFWKKEAMRSLDVASSIGLGSSDEEILRECSIRDVAYLQRSGMKAMGPWFEAHADNASDELVYGLGERINMLIPSWARTYKAMVSDYDPIENYRAGETESIASKTTTRTTTKTKAIGSDELVATDLIEGEGAGSAADNVRTLNRHGNIGVTTSQQMIQSEIELRKTKFWDLVFADLDKILTVPFYGRVGAAGPYKLTGAVVANPEESASEILAGLTVRGVTYSVVTPTYVADQLSDYVDLSSSQEITGAKRFIGHAYLLGGATFGRNSYFNETSYFSGEAFFYKPARFMKGQIYNGSTALTLPSTPGTLALTSDLASKQDKLTAGDGIKIEGNKISSYNNVNTGTFDPTSDNPAGQKSIMDVIIEADLNARFSRVSTADLRGAFEGLPSCYSGKFHLLRYVDYNSNQTFDLTFLFANTRTEEIDYSQVLDHVFDRGSAINMNNCFQGSRVSIISATYSLKNVKAMSNAFINAPYLKTIKLKDYPISFDISASTQFEEADLAEILRNLMDLTGKTTQTLTMGATNLAKLTDADKAIATNKNWILA